MQQKKDNPDCSFIRTHLFAYSENNLSESGKLRFEDHILICKECAGIVADFKSVLSMTESVKTKTPDPFILTRIEQGVFSRMEGPYKNPSFPFLKRLNYIPYTLFLIAAVFAGVFLAKQTTSKTDSEKKRQVNIQSMKSSLFISDFVEDEATLLTNR
jgi:hypothetical protein